MCSFFRDSDPTSEVIELRTAADFSVTAAEQHRNPPADRSPSSVAERNSFIEQRVTEATTPNFHILKAFQKASVDRWPSYPQLTWMGGLTVRHRPQLGCLCFGRLSLTFFLQQYKNNLEKMGKRHL
ncbi:unnamed protein product [Pleuronectes platessa]|uniref:Uncharacterized protein n=1 Tax=Pleuronectes platessa TaxID=8262 RepID=A0A9N7W348_PLEPL|nr:unnamed protein product [Pleuronectes platessa]